MLWAQRVGKREEEEKEGRGGPVVDEIGRRREHPSPVPDAYLDSSGGSTSGCDVTTPMLPLTAFTCCRSRKGKRRGTSEVVNRVRIERERGGGPGVGVEGVGVSDIDTGSAWLVWLEKVGLLPSWQ